MAFSIGIQFQGNGVALNSTDTAGVVRQSNWNVATGNSNSNGQLLHDATGAASSASVTWSADNTDQVYNTNTSSGDIKLMEGYLDNFYYTSTNNVQVSGLPSGYSGFDVYVYSQENNGANTRIGNFQISGSGITTTTINITNPANTPFAGTYTDASANGGNGNYVHFQIGAVSGFKIVPTPTGASDGNERLAINGIQIVAQGPILKTHTQTGVAHIVAPPTLTTRTQTGVANIVSPPAGQSTVSLVQSKTVTGSTSPLSLAFGASNAAGNLLFVYAGAANATLSIKDSLGNTYSLAGYDTNDNITTGLWYVQNCKSGANTVTVTATGTNGNTPSALELTIAEASGVAQVNALDQFKSAKSTSASPTSPAISPRYAGELFVALANSQEATAPNGFSALSSNYGRSLAYRIPTGQNATSAAFNSFSPISINFVGPGTPMGSTEVAGVQPLSNWNNCAGAASSSAQSLIDSHGNNTGATVTWNAVGIYYLQDGDAPGDARMMNGYLDTNNTSSVTVTVSGLPANQSYDVLVYTISASPGVEGNYSISSSGATNAASCSSLGASWNGQYIRSLSTSGNYVRLTASGSSFTVTSTPINTGSGGNQRAVIQAIQIVPTSGLILSVNFGIATAMGAGEVAGVVSASNWYNARGYNNSTFTYSPLPDNTGALRNVTLQYHTYTAYTDANLPDNPGDYRMMRGYLDNVDQKSPAITFSGLPSDVASFDVYVYVENGVTNGNRTAQYTLSGPGTATQSITFGNDTFRGYYRDGSLGGSNLGDYCVFRGVTGTSFTIDGTPVSNTDGYARSEVSGVQIVANPAYSTAIASFKPFIATTHTVRTETGIANIKALTSRLQSGISRVTTLTTRTQTGVANIRPATYRNQTGLARIKRTVGINQPATARISLLHQRDQTAASRIQATAEHSEPGLSRIQATNQSNVSGLARVQSVTTRTLTGIAHIWVSPAHVPGPGTIAAAAANSAPTISQWIPGQLPAVIRDTYPQFGLFLQKYYEWLETSGTVMYTGTITGATYNTATLGTDAQTVLPLCIGMNLVVTNGPAKGQRQQITDYDPATGIVSLAGTWDMVDVPPTGSSIVVRDNFYPSKLLAYGDIDRTIPAYLRSFHSAFLQAIPGNMVADQRRVLKYIKQFYEARGTADGFRFLFRILFGEEISFYYPTLDLFRPSDARWVTPKRIRVQANSTNSDWTARKITGVISGATAICESVSQVQLGVLSVTEMAVSSIDGAFYIAPNGTPENVQVSYPFVPPPQSDLGSLSDLLQPGTTTETAAAYSVLSQILITNPGDGYMIGDSITVNAPTGVAAKATVTAVNTTYYSGRVNALATGLAANQVALATNEIATDAYFVGASLTISSGKGAGQNFTVTAYSGTSKIATLNANPSPAPDSSSGYTIIRNIGGIVAVQVSEVGVNVTTGSTISIQSASGTGAVLTPVPGVIGTLAGYSVSSRSGAVAGQPTSPDSFASSNKILQDSYYWQDFSYEILFSDTIARYRDVVQSLVHPAGMKLFGSVALTTTPGNRVPLSASSTVTIEIDSGTYVLPAATTTTLGGVIIHQGGSVDASGNLTYTGQNTGLSTVSETGAYTDLSNQPIIPSNLIGSATISFGSVADFTAAVGASTITVTGAALGDPVSVNANPSLPPGVDLTGKVTAANTVTVEAWNISGSAVTLNSIAVTAEIVK